MTGVARQWVCRKCSMPTVDGPICNPCNGGRNGAARNPVYDDPAWRRLRTRLVAEHVRLYGQRCLRCGRATGPANPLSLDHPVPLAAGGNLMQQGQQVVCRKCNSELRSIRQPQRHDRRAQGLRRSRSRTVSSS